MVFAKGMGVDTEAAACGFVFEIFRVGHLDIIAAAFAKIGGVAIFCEHGRIVRKTRVFFRKSPFVRAKNIRAEKALRGLDLA